MPPRHPSGENIQPELVLAIRYECDQAVAPVLLEVRAINQRLATGDTALALLRQEMEQHKASHRIEPSTGRTERKKEMHPLAMAVLSGALGAIGSVAALWFLVGIGQQAAKS